MSTDTDTDAIPVLAHRKPEAARRIGVSERTLERLIADGSIEARRIGRRVIVTEDELRRFLGAQPIAS